MTVWELVCNIILHEKRALDIRDEYLCIYLDYAEGSISEERAKILCDLEFDKCNKIYW